MVEITEEIQTKVTVTLICSNSNSGYHLDLRSCTVLATYEASVFSNITEITIFHPTGKLLIHFRCGIVIPFGLVSRDWFTVEVIMNASGWP